MSYNDAKKYYSTEHIDIVDITADYCSREYGDGQEDPISTLPTVTDEAGSDDGTATSGVETTTLTWGQLSLAALRIPPGESITMGTPPSIPGNDLSLEFFYSPTDIEFPPIRIGYPATDDGSTPYNGFEITIDSSGELLVYPNSPGGGGFTIESTGATKAITANREFVQISSFPQPIVFIFITRVYINGSEKFTVAQGSSSGPIGTPDNPFQITQFGSSTSDIVVSEVRFWDSATESINETYRLSDPTGPFAYWPMSDYTIGCLAELGVTGNRKCFNTKSTCQVRQTFIETTKTYRHISPRVGHIAGTNLAVPDIKGVDISPTEIDIGGGLGRRASLSVNFGDHPGSDIGIDKYRDERISGAAQSDGVGYDPTEQGTYWGKWRARNAFYTGALVEHYSGYIVNEELDLNNFQKRTYILEQISNPDNAGNVKLVAKDPLKQADLERAQCPTPNTGRLQSAIAAGDTSATLAPEGIGNIEYSRSGKLRINSEVMEFNRSGDTLSLTRGVDSTEVDDHDADDTVQECYVFDGATVDEVIETLLIDFANVDASYINSSEWATEAADNFDYAISSVIADPVGVRDLLLELAESAPHQLWWDERNSEIRFQAIKAPSTELDVLNDDANFVENSISIRDMPDKRLSQIWFRYGQRDPTEDLKESRNFRRLYVRADLQSQSDYGGEPRIKTVYSRWITAANQTFARDSAALLGKRWARIPRMAEFTMKAKDNDKWTGDTVAIRHRNLQNDVGEDQPRNFQIISAKESGDFVKYKAVEVLFAPAIPEDDETPVYSLLAEDGALSINIREEFEQNIGEIPSSAITLNYTVPAGVTIGGNGGATLSTGTFPDNVTLNISIEADVYGQGGNGGEGGYAEYFESFPGLNDGSDGEDGQDAITIDHDCTITINAGVTVGAGGGGAGGGGAWQVAALNENGTVGFFYIGGNGGSGGAGSPGGAGGDGGLYSTSGPVFPILDPNSRREGLPGAAGSTASGGASVSAISYSSIRLDAGAGIITFDSGFDGVPYGNGAGGSGGGIAASGSAGSSSFGVIDETIDEPVGGTGNRLFIDVESAIATAGSGGSAGRAIVNTGSFTVNIDNNGTITGDVVGTVNYI